MNRRSPRNHPEPKVAYQNNDAEGNPIEVRDIVEFTTNYNILLGHQGIVDHISPILIYIRVYTGTLNEWGQQDHITEVRKASNVVRLAINDKRK
jgi:hypothetical protein